jgi:SAM-dependent methyltransferase
MRLKLPSEPIAHSPRRLLRGESIADYSIREALLRHKEFVAGTVLDLGCGSRPYEAFFNGRVARWVGADYQASGHPPATRVDVFADAMQLPLAGGRFDTVLCTQVLEHVPEPLDLLREAWRVLRPGGHLVLTAPQYNSLHGEPQDFYRYTRYGLDHLARKAGFTVKLIEPIGGFLSLFAFFTTIHCAPLRLWPINGLWQWAGWKLDGLFSRPKDCLGYILVAARPSKVGKRDA